MPFEIGHKKMGGRPKGSSSTTKLVREVVEAALGKTIPERLIEIAKKQPKEEKDILLALLAYSYSKLAPKEDEETVETRSKSDAALVAATVTLLQTKVREKQDDTHG